MLPGHSGENDIGDDGGYFLAQAGLQALMSFGQVIATIRFEPGKLDDVLQFLKRTRSELRMIRKTHVFRDRVHVIDVNGDRFEIEGVGYADTDVVPILQAVNTAFNTATIHKPTDDEYKEFTTGRRYTWAADRVM
jgi:hypothetical protein